MIAPSALYLVLRYGITTAKPNLSCSQSLGKGEGNIILSEQGKTYVVQVPREVLTPMSAAQEDAGPHNVLLKKKVNRETLSGIVHYSRLTQLDRCFDLIPVDFLGLDRPV